MIDIDIFLSGSQKLALSSCVGKFYGGTSVFLLCLCLLETVFITVSDMFFLSFCVDIILTILM